MAEFRGIQTSWFLILMLQFRATEQGVTVRDGDDVTLPCNSVAEDQNNCDSTLWLSKTSRSRTAAVLVRNGQINEAEAESDRLSVSQNCSLVMKKVTRADVGRYVCRHNEDAEVPLSVVSMTEETSGGQVTLRCTVWAVEECKHTVKWMNGGGRVDKDNQELETSQSPCFASLSFKTSHFFHSLRFASLKCEVTDGDHVMQFSLRNSPSGDETAADKTTPTEEDTKAGDTTTTSANREASLERQIWVYVLSAVLLVAVLIIIVFVVRWKINKGNTTRRNNNDGPTAPPAAEAALMAGPEEGVSYATVNYTQKADSKAQGRSNHGDDAVIYSSVEVSSADPSNLYASIA
ncbi:uncharacterized protein AB9W97_003422 isoform 2-T5 [Spinachia spinachia]